MSGKKKKAAAAGKKGGKKGGADASGAGGDAAAAAKQEELKKLQEAYELQRQKDRLAELEAKNKELSEEREAFQERLDSHAKKQRDIIWYLHREIKSRDEEIAALKARQLELLREVDAERKAVEQRGAQASEDLEAQAGVYEEKMLVLKGKLSELEKFTRLKSEMEAQLKQLRVDLEREKREHALNVQELERRNVSEKAHLKKEMLRKVKETKVSLLALTQDQLSTTTRRTIEENEQVTTELHYQSRLTEQLVAENNDLVAQNKAMRRQLELHDESERMLSQRTVFLQKVIKKLNEKTRSLESAVSRDQSRFGAREREAEEEMARRENAALAAEARCRELERALGAVEAERAATAEKLAASERASQRILLLQDEAATFIMTCIEDVKRERARGSAGGGEAAAKARAASRGAAADSKAAREGPELQLGKLGPDEREEVLSALFRRLQANGTGRNILGRAGAAAAGESSEASRAAGVSLPPISP